MMVPKLFFFMVLFLSPLKTRAKKSSEGEGVPAAAGECLDEALPQQGFEPDFSGVSDEEREGRSGEEEGGGFVEI